MKCKSTLTRELKGYIEFALRHYCERQRELEQYRADMMPSHTTHIDGIGAMGGKTTDITADTALRLATDTYILRAEMNCRAITCALTGIDDTDQKLIGLVYWKSTHTPEGAAQVANISTSQAYRRLNRILYRIAVEMGDINM